MSTPVGRRTGLTLGKFAPLHRGHQLVIETALAEMDELIVLVYDAPEVTPIPLHVRAGWVRDLYPAAEVREVRGAPAEVGDAPELRRRHEQVVLGVLGGRRVTHFYSSEFYGDHLSRALGAANRLVDPERRRFAVSGTRIRQDPFAHRDFVPARVYGDLVTNVVFVGAPSTGKTTLAEKLARRHATAWMPEYGREYWLGHQVGRRLTPEQLVEIAEGHLEREQRLLLAANRWLFTDTNAITTYMFALAYHGSAHRRLIELARAAERRYDLVCLCDTDIPYEDSWDRSGEVDRLAFQARIRADLEARGVPYVTLRGSVEERARTVGGLLAGAAARRFTHTAASSV